MSVQPLSPGTLQSIAPQPPKLVAVDPGQLPVDPPGGIHRVLRMLYPPISAASRHVDPVTRAVQALSARSRASARTARTGSGGGGPVNSLIAALLPS
jgi:hypothetical protein